MPTNVTITAEELQELLAARDERDTLRSTLRLVTAERDLAEERPPSGEYLTDADTSTYPCTNAGTLRTASPPCTDA
ncbi:hypothetical protein WJ60_30140 [Burkholderia ubonensis]|uniref:hypothetical protein n=1 Tax=Burkholderia ubonensis TaxID=101571 RepID=UPI00075AAEC0|nr:hypothetical protein WJ60_30140 [Burkholderia ubonensis]